MKKILLVTLLILIAVPALFAQAERYSQVKILADDHGILSIAKLGIPVDEGVYKRGESLTIILSESELQKISNAGFSYTVLQEDYSRFIEERNNGLKSLVRDINSNKHQMYDRGGSTYSVPEGFHLGSMGGFYSPEEVMHELDSLHLKYPTLVSARQEVSSQSTIEGRSIYYVKISDNPNNNENEPKLIFDALTHAREPEGMQQLFFFFNWLLEHYNTDDEAKYLIDNTEMYFIPIMNPDGFAYNFTTNPGGGGMWRKNRRNNGDGSYGVDLNRNYGYKWGYDDTGSSPNTFDETYRGTGPFSEAETQIARDFSIQKAFKLAMNNHTYQNLFLYPWSYIVQDTPDSNYFKNYARIMTRDNRFMYGVPGAVLYTTNGDSNDWMYGDVTSKPKVYAFTAEIGNLTDGFWPDPSRIIPLCQDMMWMNLRAAHMVGVYAEAEDESPVIFPDKEGYFHYDITRYGLDYTGTYTVSIIPLDSTITSIGPSKDFTWMSLFHPLSDSVAYTLTPDIQPGTSFRYLLNVYDGHCNHSDTITKYFGDPIVAFNDSCNDMSNWTSPKWNMTNGGYHSAPSSITDSPSGNYSGNENNTITQKMPVLLNGSPVAVVEFWAKWKTEYGADYVQFKYTSDGGANWYPLEGDYTRDGTGYEMPGEPVYDGFQNTWVHERLMLTDTSSAGLKFRYVLKSDPYTNYDGYYFDDFKVTVIDMSTVPVPEISKTAWSISDPVPNPANEQTTIYFNIPQQVSGSLTLSDLRGTLVRSVQVNGNMKSVTINTQDLAPGIYFYRIESLGGFSGVKKMIIR